MGGGNFPLFLSRLQTLRPNINLNITDETNLYFLVGLDVQHVHQSQSRR